jgi:hypothetical protein
MMQMVKRPGTRIVLLAVLILAVAVLIGGSGDRASDPPDRNVPGATTGPGKDSLVPAE